MDLPEPRINRRTKSVKLASKIGLLLLLSLAYNAYLVYAIYFHMSTGRAIDFCDGLGFLLVITGIIYISLFYFLIVKKYCWNRLVRVFGGLQCHRVRKMMETKGFFYGITFIVIIVVVAFLIVDTANDRYRFFLCFILIYINI